jgi:UDP-N-acetylmuramoyl-L-alanyl-D-glutamate--2,6-diaminopimelate ligase
MAKFKNEVGWWKQRIKNVYHLANSIYWVAKCGYPAKKLTVIGVTGTDGKTTTCTLLYEVLKAVGIRVGAITTVTAKYVNEKNEETEIETGLHTTNPDARRLQPILKEMTDAGVTHVVLEVTAHGLDQYRVWGCNIKIGVLTNITRDHLDDFLDMKRYIGAKLKLFKGVQYAVLNKDDPAYEQIRQGCDEKCTVMPYTKSEWTELSPALAGDYNRYNLAAVTTVAEILKVPEDAVRKSAKNFLGVSGRREEVKAGQNFRTVVDFAHTPNALKSVLTQLRSDLSKSGRLIAVFGCTGERDKGKRPLMGEIAAELADVIVITSDDIRSENQDEIAKQIISGMADPELRIKNGTLVTENDRRKAIGLAVKMAKAGDIVLLAGKGHEKSILIGKTEQPWSDVDEAKAEIKMRLKGKKS